MQDNRHRVIRRGMFICSLLLDPSGQALVVVGVVDNGNAANGICYIVIYLLPIGDDSAQGAVNGLGMIHKLT